MAAAAWGGGGLARPGVACQGAGGGGSSTMSLQYGAEETPLAGSYGPADSFPKDFGYGVEEEEEEAAAAGGGVGAGAGGGCGPGGADSSKPRILLMGLRRSGKSSIQKVSGASPAPPPLPLPPLPGGVGGRRGGGPEEGGGRAVPARFLFSSGEQSPGAALAGTPILESTPRSAEADWVPALPEWPERGRCLWHRLGPRLLGPSPCAIHETETCSPVLTWRTSHTPSPDPVVFVSHFR